MVFSSPVFLFVFLPLVLSAYYAAPRGMRNSVLLAASLVFYAWGEPHSILLMVASILFNYLIGLALQREAGTRFDGPVLAFGVAVNLALLAVFKYAGFLDEMARAALAPFIHLPPPRWSIALPVGISFFTFHAISYLVDIRRRQAHALANPLTMGLYIALFPQLVAGPIIRFHDVADQLLHRRNTLARFASGIERFVLGLGKKVLVANVLGPVADAAFGAPGASIGALSAWVGLACYTLQIYFDFSGYSDMAIGLGRMFGFELPENFNYPYIATSIRGFWRRWHISLSTWFRDYLYIPLGGSRRGPWRTRLNLFIVFVLCGLWHGANVTFLIWGLIHGLLLGAERGRWGAVIDRAPRPLAHAYTLAGVAFAWVFFRAPDLGAAFAYLGALAGLAPAPAGLDPVLPLLDGRVLATFAAALVLATPVATFSARDWRHRRFPRHAGEPSPSPFAGLVAAHEGTTLAALRGVAAIVILAAATADLAEATYSPFLYFKF